MSVEIENYTSCKFYIGSEVIMYTEAIPEVDSEKKTIKLPEIHVKDAFLGKYLGEDFMIEIWESDCDEPAIYLYDAGITKFGMINLRNLNGERVVTIEDMVFEFAWGNDIKERIEADFVD